MKHSAAAIIERLRKGKRPEKDQGTSLQIPDWGRDLEYEKCVLCGMTTQTPKNLTVDSRHGYVEGIGQLCEACRRQLY